MWSNRAPHHGRAHSRANANVGGTKGRPHIIVRVTSDLRGPRRADQGRAELHRLGHGGRQDRQGCRPVERSGGPGWL